jgi:hypothetical protein
MDGIYDILNWMTGDNLFTHQLPRAMDECRGPLLAQHPDLAAVEVPESFSAGREAAREAVAAWLLVQVAVYGETRPVAPLSEADHTRINPLAEIQIVAPGAQVIGVIIPQEKGGNFNG